MKLKQKLNRKRRSSSLNEASPESSRPLLVLLDNDSEKSMDPIMSKTKSFLRPRTSPANKPLTTRRRINPLLALLDGTLDNSNHVFQQQLQQQHPFESSSFYSSSSLGTTGSRIILPSKLINQHKESQLDALYRMALQNQTAYKPVERKLIEERKLQDREFAVQYRALKGSMRMTRLTN